MARHYETERLEQIADVITAPHVRQETDRTFGLPTRLYAVTVGAYIAFLGVMAAGFQSREMILPMAIFVAYIVMAFGVPALWTRMKPGHPSHALSWSRFTETGIDTWTGRIKASDAVLQVLILPVLILLWGITVVVIAALV
jgi:hypothetical protein